jgi:lipoprotein-anchoring transpeptidase ErfK/SrfK
MRLRALAVSCALVALPVASAQAADTRVIAAGVSVQGVDLSGQTVDQAAATLTGALAPHLSRPVVVTVGAQQFRLRGDQAGFVFDALLTAKRAFYAGQKSAGQPVAVVPAVRHATAAVRGWAEVVRKRVLRPGRDATARITVKHIAATHSRAGVSVDAEALVAAVDKAFDDPAAPRRFRQPVVEVRPKVTYTDLLRKYGTVLTVDRTTFTLRLFKRLKQVKRYGIAVGMAGLETPAGLYAIHEKQVDPAWHVPNSAWAGSLAGQVIPGGAPDNPLKARWLGIANGVGIHGTAEDWSIGTRASHGCIRMHVADVIALYRRVPVGTPVLIH